MPHSGRETNKIATCKQSKGATASNSHNNKREERKLLEQIPARATFAKVAVEAYGIAKPAAAQQQQQKKNNGKNACGKSTIGPQCELIALMMVDLTSTRHLLSSTSWMVSA
ncbi:unnamed protein product [Polarella glacialis]|uniref:Uncharacterized protein n=1 Tax=Polarella glacialis TaxID=89957 RepID=A0A813L9Z4_POLGL|nr:unnamed protein product [Polarella glacialis]